MRTGDSRAQRLGSVESSAVVISRAFYFFLLHKHFINRKKIIFLLR
jgi:hypothetical protein